MNVHRDDWRYKRFERSLLSHASVCCLDRNPEWTDNARINRESYWII